MSIYKLDFYLKQHTPIIHFQHDELGATLRASELKPKLDKFLIKYFNENNTDYKNFLIKNTNALNYKVKISIDKSKNQIIDLDAFTSYFGNIGLKEEEKIYIILDNLKKIGENNYNYIIDELDSKFEPNKKVKELLLKIGTIFIDENLENNDKRNILITKIKEILNSKKNNSRNENTKVELNKLINSINCQQPQAQIYTSINKKIEVIFSDIKGVINSGKVKIDFICYDKDLKKAIETNLPLFLILHNFGTRQNKGFGCFYLDSVDSNYKTPIELLKSNKNKFIYGKYSNTTTSLEIAKKVPTIYSLMKSGLNFPDTKNDGKKKSYYKSFLFRYMLGKNINNINICNEKKFIKEKFFKPEIRVIKSSTDTIPRKYVRALLGISDGISFKDPIDKKDRRVGTVSYKNDKMERFQSPILFKIIDNIMFIIPKDIEKAVFGEEFTFSGVYKDKRNENVPVIEKIKVPEKTEFNIYDFIYEFAEDFNNLIVSPTNNIFDIAITSAKKAIFNKVNYDK